MKAWWGGAAAVTLALMVPGVANAAPKDSCPGGASGWVRLDIEVIAHRIWPDLVDPSPWANEAAFAAYVDGAVDRNDDDLACVTTRWGDRPSEHARWYGIPLYLVVDNRANG